MKFKSLILIVVLVYLLPACSGHGEDANKITEGSKSGMDPVGIILNPKGSLPGMDIVAVLVPEAEHQKVAEGLSQLFHTARAACEQELSDPPIDIHTIPGITIFEGKISAKLHDEKDDGMRCLIANLNGKQLKGFGEKTHVMDIQLRLRRAQ